MLNPSNGVQVVQLSHYINSDTPTYGGKERFNLERTTCLTRGDSATNSKIHTTAHIGTHIDLSAHFYSDGSMLSDYPADFWFFRAPLFVEITPLKLVISDDLYHVLDEIEDRGFDILIVKTGMGSRRGSEEYWCENYGFHADVYDYLKFRFPSLRLFGFDTISVSSFTDRGAGRAAHKRFLNPSAPILLLEDMNLESLSFNAVLQSVIVAPLMVEKCEAAPCTVFGMLT